MRVGRNSDGGYVVPKELIDDDLLTCGINDEISFEESYLRFISKPNIHAFDGTIAKFPSINPNFNFHKLNIGPTDTTSEISLNSIIDKYFKNGNKIFLKMDIEGAEYTSFDTLSESNLNKFSCIVIEVHWIDREYQKFEKLMNKIEDKFFLVHKHDNNNGKYFIYENKLIPNVHELTFIRKDLIGKAEVAEQRIHIECLDYVNNPRRETKTPDL